MKSSPSENNLSLLGQGQQVYNPNIQAHKSISNSTSNLVRIQQSSNALYIETNEFRSPPSIQLPTGLLRDRIDNNSDISDSNSDGDDVINVVDVSEVKMNIQDTPLDLSLKRSPSGERLPSPTSSISQPYDPEIDIKHHFTKSLSLRRPNTNHGPLDPKVKRARSWKEPPRYTNFNVGQHNFLNFASPSHIKLPFNKQRHSVPSSTIQPNTQSTIMYSDETTGVEDHFARALGGMDIWMKIRDQSKISEQGTNSASTSNQSLTSPTGSSIQRSVIVSPTPSVVTSS